MATVMLVFARAIGFLARAPGISRANVPAAARVGLALALALAVAPAQTPPAHVEAARLTLALASEALVGAVLGLGATLVAEAAAGAGRLLDDLVGLRASIPGLALAPAGFGSAWSLVFIVAFFALGGVDALFTAFAHSYAIVPLGSALDLAAMRRFGFGFAGGLVRLALELAAPAIVVALTVHVSVAALGRIFPRFGNITLGFPLAYAAVLLAGFASLLRLAR